MNELEALNSKYGVSKPVFRLTLSDNEDYITSEIVERYRPDLSKVTDPLERLICVSYNEKLAKDNKSFVNATDLENVYRQTISFLMKVFDKNAEYRNPEQTNMYKWLDYVVKGKYNDKLMPGMISLYRYAFTNCPHNIHEIPIRDKNNPHVKNVLAILDKIKEKYGE